MSVKISHPPLPNIYQSQIGDLQKLAESKNTLRSFMLAHKITKQQNLGNLEELYKPILNNHFKQISEVQNTNVKLDESKNELTNILNQLVANGNLTAAASDNIVKQLDKIDKGVFKELLNIAKKKPEAIALLKTLSKYPNVVEAIKFPDEDKIKNLTMDEKKIFNALEILDDRTLKILVDYYSNINVKSDDVFDTSLTQDITEEKDIGDVDSGTATATDISTISKPPAINYGNSIVNQQQAAKIYESIKSPANRNLIGNINNYLNAYYPINDNNDSITESGKNLVISYIIKNNIKIDKRANPWKLISADNNNTCFNDLDAITTIHQQQHSGSGIKSVKFLSSDPKILINKFKILLAEKMLEIIMYSMRLVRLQMS